MIRQWTAPLAAGLLACGAAFAIVAVGDDGASPTRQVTAADRQGDSTSGKAIFARMGCGSCHHLAEAGSSGAIGPDLDQRLPAHDRASLKAVIADRDRGGDFVAMPQDFGRRMNDAELAALIDFLMAARN